LPRGSALRPWVKAPDFAPDYGSGSGSGGWLEELAQALDSGPQVIGIEERRARRLDRAPETLQAGGKDLALGDVACPQESWTKLQLSAT
jgi:hypothetical protein